MLDLQYLRCTAEKLARTNGFSRAEAEDIASEAIYRCLKGGAQTLRYGMLAVHGAMTDAARSRSLRWAQPIDDVEAAVDPWGQVDAALVIERIPCEVVAMRVEGYGFDQIGAALGLTTAGAKSRFHRARQALREAMR